MRLNLPEFTWLISCSIASDHCLIQFLKEMLVGCLQAIRAGGPSMGIKDLQLPAITVFSNVLEKCLLAVYKR